MKTIASVDQPLLATGVGPMALITAAASRVGAYVSLTKPRLVSLVLVTVAVGYLLGHACRRSPGVARDRRGDARRHGARGRWRQCVQSVARAWSRRANEADRGPGAAERPRPTDRGGGFRRPS